MNCPEMMIVLKMSHNYFFLIKVDLKLTWNQGKIRELPWNDDCFENGSQLFVIFNQGWSQVDLQSR